MSATVPESGSLAEVSLPRIILDLYANRFTGVLELSRARTRKSFVLQDGALVGSESNLPAEKLCVILEDAGLLSRLDRSRVDAEIRSSGSAEGVALLSLQVIEAKQLFEGLREQLRKRVIECFGWTSGDFRIEATESRSDDVQPFRMDPFKLAQEGVEKHWNLDRMLETLTPNLNQYASAGSRLGKVVHHLSLGATVERMIAGLSGNQTPARVLLPCRYLRARDLGRPMIPHVAPRIHAPPATRRWRFDFATLATSWRTKLGGDQHRAGPRRCRKSTPSGQPRASAVV